MSLNIGAYIYDGKDTQGYDVYKFAPINNFRDKNVVDNRLSVPQIKLTANHQNIIENALFIDFTDPYIFYKGEDVKQALVQLRDVIEEYTDEAYQQLSNSHHELVAFFEVCKVNGYCVIGKYHLSS